MFWSQVLEILLDELDKNGVECSMNAVAGIKWMVNARSLTSKCKGAG